MKAEFLGQCFLVLARFLLVVISVSANADTIQLTNGDRLSGKITNLGRTECILTTAFQSNLHIPLRRIALLQTDHTVSVTLNNGEQFDGLVDLHLEQKSLKIRSKRFGSVVLRSEELASLSNGTAASNATLAQIDKQSLTSRQRKATESASSSSVNDVSENVGEPQKERRAKKQTAPEQADDQLLASLQGKGAEDASPSSENHDSEKIGAEQKEQQDEEEVQQVFLRASGVLLKPGDIQLEVSANYGREEQANAILANTIVAQSRIRTFLFPFIARMGLFPRTEGYLTVPFQYQERGLTVAANQFGSIQEDQSSLFSIGDVLGGVKYAFLRENSWPEIIGNVDFRAPTGRVWNPLLPSASVTGSGQWTLGAGLSLIKSFDPVILFGGFRYEYNLRAQHADLIFGPWSALNYNLGFGFAVNDCVTLVGQFMGSYQGERTYGGRDARGIDLDGTVIPDREIATLRGAFTYKLGLNKYIEPSITFGLTDVSPDLVIGLSYNQRL